MSPDKQIDTLGLRLCPNGLLCKQMKIAVFGASGLLGAAVCRESVARGHQILSYASREWKDPRNKQDVVSLPLDRFEQVMREVFDHWPDAIVNCAAVSSPDAVDRDPPGARLINVDAALRLGELAAHLGARYVHLSTDMVFDGTSSPYRSTDRPRPLSEYGRQKLEAEKRVLAASEENVVVLRITLLNGNSPRGDRSPHERILSALAKGESPVLFTDEWRQTSSAENVAQAVVELIERPSLNGLFHWAGSEVVSRHELGRLILRKFGFREDRIQASSLAEAGKRVGDRPGRLTFELAPLIGKLKTRPASIERQLEEMRLPDHLYVWHRENADYPTAYTPRF